MLHAVYSQRMSFSADTFKATKLERTVSDFSCHENFARVLSRVKVQSITIYASLMDDADLYFISSASSDVEIFQSNPYAGHEQVGRPRGLQIGHLHTNHHIFVGNGTACSQHAYQYTGNTLAHRNCQNSATCNDKEVMFLGTVTIQLWYVPGTECAVRGERTFRLLDYARTNKELWTETRGMELEQVCGLFASKMRTDVSRLRLDQQNEPSTQRYA